MGNTSTKESRSSDGGHRSHHSAAAAHADSSATNADRSSSRRNRVSRADLALLGLASTGGGSSSRADAPHERRETKQEREIRRLERERLARIAERERSMREEHVDGGYLVTMGVYNGPEDFNKQIVRQLIIERKLAPFWRGLNDFDEQWTEAQIVAAARGLPVPAADEIPPENLIPRPPPPQPTQSTASDTLTIPETQGQSEVSEPSSPTSPTSRQPQSASVALKPRGKAIAAVLGGHSRNGSTSEIAPREVQLPHDPFVNGQPIEVFLYKNAVECPICFLYYPPYLNHTRCCNQPICSECFVQIKRPDPHFPDGHNENDPNRNPEEAAGLLVSEPACCPYCTQSDFGVTYEPPPFRRGLVYSISPTALGATNAAMSSSSSVNSTAVGTSGSGAGRRRNQSLSASDPSVILTDRIRPEWAAKLQAARAHQARRAAAATALHAAAFLMGSSENRAFRSRFGRRSTAGSGSASGSGANAEGDNGDPVLTLDTTRGRIFASGSDNRRSRLEDLEEMMFLEAVRLSIAAEEERKRKAEKEARKEAKKKEKEERKAAKAAVKQAGPYEGAGGRSGHSSASASSLSLSGLGFGRKRGNSAASNLRVEASITSAMATGEPSASDGSSSRDKGKAVERPLSAGEGNLLTREPSSPGTSTSAASPRAIPHLPAGPSHLRQMSNASSVSSSIFESQPGSFSSPSNLQDPHGSVPSLGSRSGSNEDAGNEAERDRDPNVGTEPVFNFRNLAEVVGVGLDEARAEELPSNTQQTEQSETTVAESPVPPTVTVTPDTSATPNLGEDSKQVGFETAAEQQPQQFTQ